ncbi:MAG: carbonic anhydrase [Pseudomonadota bacterium]
MKKEFSEYLKGLKQFRKKYAKNDDALMHQLASNGQVPRVLVVSCSDSRVDPALLMQCNPGELFVIRNVANIIPPYEQDGLHHGTSAALEYGVCYLGVNDLILLGHSDCGGIRAFLNPENLKQNDFISSWVNLLNLTYKPECVNECARDALIISYKQCLTFPWIRQRVEAGTLTLHVWFFEISTAKLFGLDINSFTFHELISDEELD